MLSPYMSFRNTVARYFFHLA